MTVQAGNFGSRIGARHLQEFFNLAGHCFPKGRGPPAKRSLQSPTFVVLATALLSPSACLRPSLENTNLLIQVDPARSDILTSVALNLALLFPEVFNYPRQFGEQESILSLKNFSSHQGHWSIIPTTFFSAS